MAKKPFINWDALAEMTRPPHPPQGKPGGKPDHGRPGRRLTKNLNHWVDKCGCLTTAGCTDDKSVHRRSQIQIPTLRLTPCVI